MDLEGLATFLLEDKDIAAEELMHLYNSAPDKISIATSIAYVGATLPYDEKAESPLVIVAGVAPDLTS
ncbi:MAG: hypothetical protein V3U25_01255 [Nitrososphaerales archaeon]